MANLDLVARYGKGWAQAPYRRPWPRNIHVERMLQELQWLRDPVALQLSGPGADAKSLGTGMTYLPGVGDGTPATVDFSVPEKFLLYAQYLWLLGGQKPRRDLMRGRKVVLALRRPTTSTVNKGKGVFDDRFVLLWRNAERGWVVREMAANTEPSAQYDAGAANPKKFTAMAGVGYKKPEGEDRNDDGVRDLGRLEPGVYDFTLEVNEKRSVPLNRVFRITVPPKSGNHVSRDINHDGLFLDGQNGLDKLNSSFLIHKGGDTNTWSAGCQTLPANAPSGVVGFFSEPRPWPTFYDLMSAQKSLVYTLVSVSSPYLTRASQL